jgi:hypothetical protein
MGQGIASAPNHPPPDLTERQAHRSRNVVLLGASSVILAIGGTWLLYGDSVRLPFLFDDMIHLRWLDWHSLPSIWATAEGLGYYRPLTMSIWKVSASLLGYNNPALYHSLNLLLHALNSILVSCVAWRAYRRRGRMAFALLASALFLTFPFSYQAVPSSSSLSKPLIATLTLASALLYWESRHRDSRWLLAFSLLAGFLAPFAYESGVMVPVAIIAVELLGYSRKEFQRLSWLPVLYLVMIWFVALPIVILMEPESGASLGLPSLINLSQNGVYFVEGLLFPLTPLATPLERVLGLDQYLLLGLLELLGFALLCLSYWWTRHVRLLLYALSWFVVGVLPLWLMLDFGYVITSPRLHYLAAVGSALLWAGIPILLWTNLPARWWAKALAIAAVVGMLTFNTLYVRDKMSLANMLSAPLWQAARAAEREGNSGPLLYLNVPAWIAPKTPTYRVGTEGLTFIPGYVRVQDFVYVTTGAEPEIHTYMFDATKQDLEAYIGYAGTAIDWDTLTAEIRQADAVYLTTYSPEGLRFVEAGALDTVTAQPDEGTAVAQFGEEISLLDYQLERSEDDLVVSLRWFGQELPARDITTFLHLYDSSGQLIAQGDGYPLLGLSPPTRWQATDLVRDVRYLTLPDDFDVRQYSVVVGWYDVTTGQRLTAHDAYGQRAPNDAFLLTP